jgi:hypothetical protein
MDIGSNEVENYDGMENLPLLAVTNAWAAKAVQRCKKGKLRGKRIQIRNKVKEDDESKPVSRKAKRRKSTTAAVNN